MITSKRMCLLISLYLSTLFTVGQTPAYDPNWVPNLALSDEFQYVTGPTTLNGLSANNVSITVGAITGTYSIGETIQQTTTNATATVVSISYSPNVLIVNLPKSSTGIFDATDKITGQSSGAYSYATQVIEPKWQILSECGTPQYGFNFGGSSAFRNDSQYVYVYPQTGNGYLHLKVDGNTNSQCGAGWTCLAAGCTGSSDCALNTGGIQSNGNNYSYGYVEMSAKLPGYVDGSGVAHGDRFWPAFWMAYDPYCSKYDEIDMLDECCCSSYENCNNLVSALGYPGPGADSCQRDGVPSFWTPTSVPLCSAFHKYGVEWNTNRLVFYFDDVPYYQLNNTSISLYPMQLLIDLQLYCGCSFHAGTPWPQFMLVDYLRDYQLRHDCSTNLVFASDAQISSYTYAVENTITFGNGTNPFDLSMCTPAGGYSGFVFRAVNGFTIPKNGYSFKVPQGTVLMLIPTACN